MKLLTYDDSYKRSRFQIMTLTISVVVECKEDDVSKSVNVCNVNKMTI